MTSSRGLEEQLSELKEMVQKQSKLLAQTGKQLMELQLKDVKNRMAGMETKAPAIDPEDFASNEDIAQLVFEVLNQLDYLEDRNVARTYNGHILSLSPVETKIAPLPSKDGELAPSIFPATVQDLLDLKAIEVIELCEFYDLFVDESETNENDLSATSPEEVLKMINAEGKISAQDRLLASSEEDVKKIFDEFTRYIGVRIRRGSGW